MLPLHTQPKLDSSSQHIEKGKIFPLSIYGSILNYSTLSLSLISSFLFETHFSGIYQKKEGMNDDDDDDVK